ncbi:MAG: hypothetical protein KF893_07785 [Caldilineaceae bacterium]|nr:hypothetical protein [Caldilineaceae bacterium]
MLNQDFKEFIQSLNDNNVRYLVVGGYAVALHGHPRYTKDIEVSIDGVIVNFIAKEDLRRNKQASGRLQDLADLENLT